jgi:hypothetical protein
MIFDSKIQYSFALLSVIGMQPFERKWDRIKDTKCILHIQTTRIPTMNNVISTAKLKPKQYS